MKIFQIGIGLFFLSSMSITAKETLDLNGEWDATFICSISGTYKEIIKITQNADAFVGIRLSGDKRLIEEGDETRFGEKLKERI